MDSAQSTAVRFLVPQFAEDINSLAREHGLAVRTRVALPDGEKAHHIMADWEGTREQLLSVGLLLPSQHLPLSCGRLQVPPSCRPRTIILSGIVTVSGDQVHFEADFGPMPKAITRQGEVEVVSYEDETAYYGTADALIAAGVCDRKQLPGKKGSRCGDDYGYAGSRRIATRAWSSRTYPNGRLVHRLEALESFERREAEEYQREHAARPTAPALEPSAVNRDATSNVIQFPGRQRSVPTVGLQSPACIYLDGDVEILAMMRGLGSVGLRFVSVNDGDGERYVIVRAH